MRLNVLFLFAFSIFFRLFSWSLSFFLKSYFFVESVFPFFFSWPLSFLLFFLVVFLVESVFLSFLLSGFILSIPISEGFYGVFLLEKKVGIAVCYRDFKLFWKYTFFHSMSKLWRLLYIMIIMFINLVR